MKIHYLSWVFILFIVSIGFANTNNKPNNKNYNQKPVFIKNCGQWNSKALFLAKMSAANIWLSNDGLVYDFYQNSLLEEKSSANISKQGHVVRMSFGNTIADKISPENQLKAYHNYFIGNNPSSWIKNVPLYDKLIIQSLYSGINAVLYIDNGQLRYDLQVDANADVSQISMKFNGSNSIDVDNNGELIINTSIGNIKNGKIYAYQVINGVEKKVDCGFKLINNETATFKLGDYNSSYPLIIDPLVFSTYLGGNGDDKSNSLAVDEAGNSYITGETTSLDFPTVVGSYRTNAIIAKDIFLSKIKWDGSELSYSTYIGGSSIDIANGIAIDINNNVYLTGVTYSSDFPVTPGVFQNKINGSATDAFVCKINSSGTGIEYSTYIGGSSFDTAYSIAVDNIGNAYICGNTYSSDFPIHLLPISKLTKTRGGGIDCFYGKFNQNGQALFYSAFLGGYSNDGAYSIKVDNEYNVIIAGSTASLDFVTTSSAYCKTHNGNTDERTDAYVTKINHDFSDYIFSTFLGGSEFDCANGVDIDESGNIYVSGYTLSSNFPTTAGAYNTTFNSISEKDAFVSKLSSYGMNLVYSTFLGGNGIDEAKSIDVSNSGKIYVTGYTSSTNFPVSNTGFQKVNNGNTDLFMSCINPLKNGSSDLEYSSYFGGTGFDYGNSIFVDNNSNIYITGYSNSIDFPTSMNSMNIHNSGYNDAIILKIGNELTTPNIEIAACPTSLCAGNTSVINYISNISFNSGNIFTVQLSDTNGNFNYPISIGSVADTKSGNMTITIPSNIVASNNYRIRISGSNPVVTSPASSLIKINTLVNSQKIIGNDYATQGEQSEYSLYNNPDFIYKWTVTNGSILGSNSDNDVKILWTNVGLGSVSVQITAIATGCSICISKRVRIAAKIVSLELLSPNGGEILNGRYYQDITWDYIGKIDSLILEYRDCNNDWIVIDTVSACLKKYSWLVPNYPHNGTKIRIRACGQNLALINPLSTGILIDNSLSMNNQIKDPSGISIIEAVKTSLQNNYINYMKLLDTTYIATFNDNYSVIRDWTTDKVLLNNSISSIVCSGTANVFSAIESGYNEIYIESTNHRRSLIAITSSESDDWSPAFLSYVNGKGIPIYILPINIADTTLYYSRLEQLAHVSGGMIFPIISYSDIDSVLMQLNNNINYDVYDTSNDDFAIKGILSISPLTNEEFLVGSKQSIRFRSQGVSDVRIEYSTDAGINWNVITYNFSTGSCNGCCVCSYPWYVPNTISKNCIIRIIDPNNSAYCDTSCVFTIKGMNLIEPANGDICKVGTLKNIVWDYTNGLTKVNIEYSTNNGNNWITIASNYPASSKTFSWIIPKCSSTQCKVRIKDANNPLLYDMNTKTFSIYGDGLLVIYPNGGETIPQSSSSTIAWASSLVNEIRIELSIDNGHNWSVIYPSIPASLGSITWTVPATPSVECFIRITDVDNTHILDLSDYKFRIAGYPYPPPYSWNYNSRTGNNHIILIPNSIKPKIVDRDFLTNDAIGVFFARNDSLICCGYDKWVNDNNFSLTAWGNDNRTVIKDGYDINEKFVFKVWDAQLGRELNGYAEYESGSKDYYVNDGISILTKFKTHTEFKIPLKGKTWSMISSNILPIPSSISYIMDDVKTSMDYMLNERGEVYYPAESVNSIKNWVVSEGYQIYMLDDDTLTIEGIIIDPAKYPKPLLPNIWYIVSYLPMITLAPVDAFASINQSLVLVKNSDGKVYIPNTYNYHIDQIISCNPGEGYKLVTANNGYNVPLTYPSSPLQIGAKISKFDEEKPIITKNEHYSIDISGTGNNSVLIIESDDIPEFSEIAVLNSQNVIIGTGVIQNHYAVLTIWGDNAKTKDIVEAALNNEELKIKYYNINDNKEYYPQIISIKDILNNTNIGNKLTYKEDGYWILRANKGSIASSNSIETYETLLTNEPNPFYNSTIINYTLVYDEFVEIDIYNNLGIKLFNLVADYKNAGKHRVVFEANELSSGLYYCKMKTNNKIITSKMILVK